MALEDAREEESRQEPVQVNQQDAFPLCRANSQCKPAAGVLVSTTHVGTMPFTYKNVIDKNMEFIDIGFLTSCPH